MLNADYHKVILLKILKDIYSDTSLGSLLGFKGGTAAMLFYGLDRFSVDLDFDLLNLEKEDFVFEKIEEIIKKYGTIKNKKKKFHTLFFELSYAEAYHNIKIEINRRQFGSQYDVHNYFGIAMKVMKKEDMFANKMAALYERVERTNRDIYDVWFFLEKNWKINQLLIEKRLNMPLKNIINECLAKLEVLPNHSMLSGLGELIDQKQKLWVKEKLKKEVIFLLNVMRSNLSIEKNS